MYSHTASRRRTLDSYIEPTSPSCQLLVLLPSNPTQVQERQVADLKASLGKIHEDIPLVFMAGNHDIGNSARPETVATYKSRFGDDYFEFWARGMHGVVLNTQVFEDPQHVMNILAEQDAWMERTLVEPPTAPVRHRVVFGHIPPFLFAADEPKGYFNVEPAKRASLLALARRAGAKQWHCGHYHRNGGGVDPDGGLEVIVTSATGSVIAPTGE